MSDFLSTSCLKNTKSLPFVVAEEMYTSAEMVYYNKILQHLHANRCSTVHDGIFENTETIITSVIKKTDVTLIFFEKRNQKTKF